MGRAETVVDFGQRPGVIVACREVRAPILATSFSPIAASCYGRRMIAHGGRPASLETGDAVGNYGNIAGDLMFGMVDRGNDG